MICRQLPYTHLGRFQGKLKGKLAFGVPYFDTYPFPYSVRRVDRCFVSVTRVIQGAKAAKAAKAGGEAGDLSNNMCSKGRLSRNPTDHWAPCSHRLQRLHGL